MANITVKLKSGRVIQHEHEGRAGGSYTKQVRYEGAFAIVTDEWGKEIAYPAADVETIESHPTRS